MRATMPGPPLGGTKAEMCAQDAQDIQAAREAQLPPLQAVTELTSASAPPQRGEVPVTAEAAPSSAGWTAHYPHHELVLLSAYGPRRTCEQPHFQESAEFATTLATPQMHATSVCTKPLV